MLMMRTPVWDVTWFSLSRRRLRSCRRILALGHLFREGCVSGVLCWSSLLRWYHTGLLGAQTPQGHRPGPGRPMSPIAAPSVFQGPRFMTSEYNSKYLKEPSSQPGGCSSKTHTSLPLYLPNPHPGRDPSGDLRGTRAGTVLRSHQWRKGGHAGSVGDFFPGPHHGCLQAYRPCLPSCPSWCPQSWWLRPQAPPSQSDFVPWGS